MAEEMDYELRLDDTIEEVEAQAPVAMEVEVDPREPVQEPVVGLAREVEPREPVQEPVVAQARFHNPVEVRNYTKYELEGSPTLWFDEWDKAYVLSKDATDARPTTYLKCHRYTVKRGKLIVIFSDELLINCKLFYAFKNHNSWKFSRSYNDLNGSFSGSCGGTARIKDETLYLGKDHSCENMSDEYLILQAKARMKLRAGSSIFN